MCSDDVVAPADDEQVEPLWRALGLPGLIDVHTHFMPKRVMDAVWRYFGSHGPLIGREWPIQYQEDEEVRLQRLRSMGVRAFSAMLYPHKAGMAESLNAWGLDFGGRHDDVLTTCTFFPEPSAGEYVTAAIEAGARVFKSHVQVGNYDPADPLLDPVWGALADAQVPVVTHVGSGPVPGRFTGLDGALQVLARHPTLPMVVAHLGMPEYREFLELAETYENVRLDTTMAFVPFIESHVPFPRDLLPRLHELGLAGQVLLGTDFPNIPYPYAVQLASLVDLGLGEEWLRAVLWQSGADLFGVSV